MKFTRTSQLSALPFTHRKDFVLILFLPSRKEKRAHLVPVVQHHLPICAEPSNDGLGAGGINGNGVYFMSCRKLAGEPSGKLSWKKKMIFSYAVCLLFRKICGLILSWSWERKKEGRRVLQILGLRPDLHRAFLCFRGGSAQAQGLLLNWAVVEGRMSTWGLGGGGKRVPGPVFSGLERILHYWQLFWMGGKSSCPQKWRLFPHGNILACILVEVTTVTSSRSQLTDLTQNGLGGCHEEKKHAEDFAIGFDWVVRDSSCVVFLLKQLPWVSFCTKSRLTSLWEGDSGVHIRRNVSLPVPGWRAPGQERGAERKRH